MRNNWWKALGVILFLYTIVAGFLVPLRPGIQSSTPISAKTGESVELTVQGYNTNWNESNESLRLWIKHTDEYALAARSVEVKSFGQLSARFEIPKTLPVDRENAAFTLVIDHSIDGPAVLPNALIISSESQEVSKAPWKVDEIKELNFRKTFAFPYRNILKETIRNTYFHVPLWMAMYGLLLAATFFNIKYLRRGIEIDEEKAYHLTLVSLLYGFLGIATGMIWAEYAWGKFWSWDIKQTMALLAMLMFVAYVFIRFSIEDEIARRRFSSVYGIFAFVMVFPLIYIIPRMAPSLHPGSGGNPAFGGEDMDNTMRAVFYPAILGYILLGVWIAQLSFRIRTLKWHFLLKK